MQEEIGQKDLGEIAINPGNTPQSGPYIGQEDLGEIAINPGNTPEPGPYIGQEDDWYFYNFAGSNQTASESQLHLVLGPQDPGRNDGRNETASPVSPTETRSGVSESKEFDSSPRLLWPGSIPGPIEFQPFPADETAIFYAGSFIQADDTDTPIAQAAPSGTPSASDTLLAKVNTQLNITPAIIQKYLASMENELGELISVPDKNNQFKTIAWQNNAVVVSFQGITVMLDRHSNCTVNNLAGYKDGIITTLPDIDTAQIPHEYVGAQVILRDLMYRIVVVPSLAALSLTTDLASPTKHNYVLTMPDLLYTETVTLSEQNLFSSAAKTTLAKRVYGLLRSNQTPTANAFQNIVTYPQELLPTIVAYAYWVALKYEQDSVPLFKRIQDWGLLNGTTIATMRQEFMK